MKHLSDEQIIALLRHEEHSVVPVLPLRKKALKEALSRRIVSRPSPYNSFFRVAIPAALLLVVLFVGGGNSGRLSPEIQSFLKSSAQAVSELPPQERERIIAETGVNPDDMFRLIEKGKVVVFDSPAAEVSMMSLGAPEVFSVDTTEPVARTMLLQETPAIEDPSALGMKAAVLPDNLNVPEPVTFIRVTDKAGNSFLIGFDERFVPVSFWQE